MKKFVPAMIVALMALTMATSVSADNGKSRGKGEGLWRNLHNIQRKWERKGWLRGNAFGLERVFGQCGKDARIALGAATKTAFETYVQEWNAAKDDRDDAIEAADGDKAKIADAWEEYRDAYLAALKKYQTATMAAMTEYRADFAECDVVIDDAPTTLPEYSLDTVKNHDDPDDCWVAIDGKVYNFTSYIDNHEDDSADLQDLCGSDGSDEYDDIDDDDKPNSLTSYKIGTLE